MVSNSRHFSWHAPSLMHKAVSFLCAVQYYGVLGRRADSSQPASQPASPIVVFVQKRLDWFNCSHVSDPRVAVWAERKEAQTFRPSPPPPSPLQGKLPDQDPLATVSPAPDQVRRLVRSLASVDWAVGALPRTGPATRESYYAVDRSVHSPTMILLLGTFVLAAQCTLFRRLLTIYMTRKI